jgi:phage minor structural protein
MRKSYVTIYDLQMRRVAMLENAFGIQYEMPMNGLWTASFSLPADDPKNAECQPLYFAEIYDESERIELFRILPSALRKNSSGSAITYQCEHVLGTLLDDILFQYHTIGNLGVYTRDVLEYILSKQSMARWQLGMVDFDRQFEYNWENENLLGALFSVPKPFVDEYMWTWDTTSYPWTLNLVRPSNEVQAVIRYGVNMQGIERTIDPSNVVTRIYGLGYGEGVNQLTFSEINNGKPYLDAEPEYIAKYGLMQTVFVDRRFEYPETLMARCQALLDELKQPRVSYTVQASELYALTKDPIDKFRTGAMVRVIDKEIGEDVTFRVLNVRKQDVLGAPGNVEIEIANRPQDIAGSIADLRNRQYANDVYAQGATNFDSHDFADNCDPDHPAVIRFWVPEETVRINKVRLSYRVEAFRSYERAIESAPATTSGPSSTSTTAAGGGISTTTADGGGTTATSSSGGGTTATSSNGGAYTSTTAAGGGDTSGPSSISTTAAGGGATNWFGSAGGINFGGGPLPDFKSFIYPGGLHNHGETSWTIPTQNPDHYHVTYNAGSHTHFIYDFYLTTPDHTHGMDHTHTIPAHIHGINIPSHTHDVTIPDHTHDVEIPDHTHDVTIPDHTHGMDHTHTIPAHTHDIEYGIFEGPTPTAVTVQVDGNIVPGLGTSADEVDIIPYLSKDAGGRIQRGTWHEITVTPNGLGRIVATVLTQIFVQSRGGGDF